MNDLILTHDQIFLYSKSYENKNCLDFINFSIRFGNLIYEKYEIENFVTQRLNEIIEKSKVFLFLLKIIG